MGGGGRGRGRERMPHAACPGGGPHQRCHVGQRSVAELQRCLSKTKEKKKTPRAKDAESKMVCKVPPLLGDPRQAIHLHVGSHLLDVVHPEP